MLRNNPQTIGELKAAFTGKIRQIPKEECMRVIDNFVQVCLQRRGQHLEHILKRTKKLCKLTQVAETLWTDHP